MPRQPHPACCSASHLLPSATFSKATVRFPPGHSAAAADPWDWAAVPPCSRRPWLTVWWQWQWLWQRLWQWQWQWLSQAPAAVPRCTACQLQCAVCNVAAIPHCTAHLLLHGTMCRDAARNHAARTLLATTLLATTLLATTLLATTLLANTLPMRCLRRTLAHMARSNLGCAR
jgi:hypothetical protein